MNKAVNIYKWRIWNGRRPKKEYFFRESCVEVGLWDRLLRIISWNNNNFLTPPQGDIGFFGKEGRVVCGRTTSKVIQGVFAVLRITTQICLDRQHTCKWRIRLWFLLLIVKTSPCSSSHGRTSIQRNKLDFIFLSCLCCLLGPFFKQINLKKKIKICCLIGNPYDLYCSKITKICYKLYKLCEKKYM